jgi:hypothetical protein
VPLVFFLLSHLGTRTGLYYIDSTALPVGDVPVDVANGWALPRLTTTRPRRGWQGWNGRQGSLRAPLSGPAGRL